MRVDKALELLRRFPQNARFTTLAGDFVVIVNDEFYFLDCSDKQLPWLNKKGDDND